MFDVLGVRESTTPLGTGFLFASSFYCSILSLCLCHHLVAFSNLTYLRPVTILTNNNRESSNPYTESDDSGRCGF